MTTFPEEIKVVLLGYGGTGAKSCFVIRFVTGYYEEVYDPTIEDSYRKQTTVDNAPVLLDMLDTAGQEEFGALRPQWCRESRNFILGYAISNKESFETVEEFAKVIIRVHEDELDDVVVVLIGNKCDLVKHRQVSKEEHKGYIDKWTYLGISCTFLETSAKMNINVEETFHELVRLRRKINQNKIEVKDENNKKNKNNKFSFGNFKKIFKKNKTKTEIKKKNNNESNLSEEKKDPKNESNNDIKSTEIKVGEEEKANENFKQNKPKQEETKEDIKNNESNTINNKTDLNNNHILEFNNWLCNIVKKPQYLKLFTNEDYNDIRLIQDFDEDELSNLGIKKLHIKLFLRHINEFKTNMKKFNNWLNNNELSKYKSYLDSIGIITLGTLVNLLNKMKNNPKILINNSNFTKGIPFLVLQRMYNTLNLETNYFEENKEIINNENKNIQNNEQIEGESGETNYF